MKQKERKNIAKKIAQAELTIKENLDNQELKAKLEEEIMKLCSKAQNIEDMVAIDEMVQDILAKNS